MNKLHLIAENKETGYGVVHEGELHFMIKQPFHLDNKILLDEHDLSLLSSHGFQESDKSFDNYSQIEAYLERLLQNRMIEQGEDIKEPFNPTDYFRTLPKELVELNIEFLSEKTEDYPYVRMVHDALLDNPQYQLILLKSKKQLTQILKESKEKEFVKNEAKFPFLKKKVFLDHIDFRLNLTHKKESKMAA